jgi:hypothetical protein
MKSKHDFNRLLDEYSKTGTLPNGERLSRVNLWQYLSTTFPEGFKAENSPTRIGKAGMDKWYRHYLKGRPVTESKPTASVVDEDRRLRAMTAQRDEYKRKYDFVITQIEEADHRFDAMCAIKEPLEIESVTPAYYDSTSESIAIAQLSDLHVGESVDPATINGMNEYTPEIADKRVFNYFQNLLRVINNCRHDTKIETLFLSLTGDVMTGYIHEELMMSNSMSPTEEIRFAKRLIIRGIDFLLNYGKFKRIIIQTNFGNHGRNTKKSTHSTGHKNSYEQMMYLDLADYYRAVPQIEWNTTKSHITYSPLLFDKVIGSFHGDTVKFGGGIGGLTVPLIKYLHRLNQQQFADMYLLGHFHQTLFGHNFMVNGSVVGFTSYAQNLGCTFEEPKQNFRLLDKRRGFTGYYPIFCH